MKYVNQSIKKTDSSNLITGKPVFLDDMVKDDYLTVKVLRSPHAHAMIQDIDISVALLVPGIEVIYTYKDIPENMTRYSIEGEEYPGQGAYDRLILDRHLRYVGDAVAIVAGKDEACCEKAMRLIKVQYDVLEPILDYEKSLDSPILIHPENDVKIMNTDAGADISRNRCGHKEHFLGDVDAVMKSCDVVVERTYYTKAVHQTPIETFRSYAEIDEDGALHVRSSTQVVFLIRRILSEALNLPKEKVRVSKERVGGGFGAKGSVVSEIYPAFVTWMTQKKSKIVYTREESFTCGSPRHAQKLWVKLGANQDGTLRAVDMYVLENAGAYAEHSPTVLDLSLYVSTSVYRNWEAFRLIGDAVYTNLIPSGAYRGYGATQGHFAVECAVNELAEALHMDPIEFRIKNAIREGDTLLTYNDLSVAKSCTAVACLERVREMIGWDEKYPCKQIDDHTVRSVGVAFVSQTTAIANNMTGTAILKTSENGYELYLASGDIGTGSDTSIRQIAAEVLECDLDKIKVFSGDTKNTIHDSGSYASASLYITGKAVENACLKLKEVLKTRDEGCEAGITISEAFVPNVAPPPFLCGAVEVEIDTLTGNLKLIEYDAAVDCGLAINPTIVKAQVEGAAMQAFGMAHTERVEFSEQGKLWNNSFLQYSIPTFLDAGKLNVEIVGSEEPTGPFGAKGVGEVGMNAMAPAIQQAVYNATHFWHSSLPITAENIVMKTNS